MKQVSYKTTENNRTKDTKERTALNTVSQSIFAIR